MISSKVTAIITTHNRKELLIKAIDSVLHQTYSNIECIVIDDASDDGTKYAIEDYIQMKKISYYYIPKYESRGGNYARNMGIKLSKGEYIAFLDDDDEWMPEKIEKQVKVLDEDASIGFVYCGSIIEKNLCKNSWTHQNIQNKKYLEGNISKEILIRIITTTTTTIMVRRDIMNITGMFDENLKYWQEYEFSIRILQETNAKCVRENLILYRIIDKDRCRLSNKIEGWENAVHYIEDKHKDLICTLNKEEDNLRQVYICIDGFLRGKKAGSIKYMCKYALKIILNKDLRKVAIKKMRNRNL